MLENLSEHLDQLWIHNHRRLKNSLKGIFKMQKCDKMYIN